MVCTGIVAQDLIKRHNDSVHLPRARRNLWIGESVAREAVRCNAGLGGFEVVRMRLIGERASIANLTCIDWPGPLKCLVIIRVFHRKSYKIWLVVRCYYHIFGIIFQ